MTAHFHHDFSDVRLHADSRAANSARAIGAAAYTVGPHVVIDPQFYAAGTAKGNYLLAHELTHVLQQRNQQTEFADPLEIGPRHSPAEAEAHQHALRFGHHGLTEPIRGSARQVQRLTCEEILNATEGNRVDPNEAHRQISIDFVSQVGPQATLFAIPGASSQSLRDEGCGGKPREAKGQGIPDLSRINGRRIELAEVKIGSWPCRVLAEQQVRKYVEKGNEDAAWRRSLGIDGYDLMPQSRFTPRDFSLNGTPVSVAWCGDGVVVYKPVKGGDELFLCSTLSDQGAVSKFVDRATGEGERLANDFIARNIEPAINKAIEEKLNELHAGFLAEQAKRLLQSLKARIMAELRKEIRLRVRQYLQTALAALCATVAARSAVSLKELLKKLEKDMAVEVLVPALQAMLHRLATEALEAAWDAVRKVVLAILIAAVTIVLFILFRGAPVEEGGPGPVTNPGMTPMFTEIDPKRKARGRATGAADEKTVA